jgi:exopolyphosphatase/guanosine-5'-triphosphate,3'-diphosphate pyrophosphatase
MFRSIFIKKIFLFFPVIVLTGYLNACVHPPESTESKCIVRRAAFDIGSETTKIKVARVDSCLQKKLKVVYKQEIKVLYAENNRSGSLNTQIRNSGIIALKELKNEAINNRAEAFAGVATESFRQASDSSDFLKEVKAKTGITIKLINQEQEAVLGYVAASSAFAGGPEKIIVWNIGGESMQMVFSDKNRKYIIYQGKIASVSFKEKILKHILQRKPGQHSSPNPIGKENLKKAIEMAESFAGDVPEEIKKAIRKPDTIILGIGGVHNESIKKQLKLRDEYTREEIIKAVNSRIGLNDNEIGGYYADTEISNLILVLGFMEKLGVKRIRLVNVNLTDGILIDPSYW